MPGILQCKKKPTHWPSISYFCGFLCFPLLLLSPRLFALLSHTCFLNLPSGKSIYICKGSMELVSYVDQELHKCRSVLSSHNSLPLALLTHSDPLVSAFWVLGWQTCTIMLNNMFCCPWIFIIISLLCSFSVYISFWSPSLWAMVSNCLNWMLH